LPLSHSDAAEKTKLSNKNLDRMGFTKYEKAGDGFYEKKAGKGPDVISRD
ncbi:MAG TPA: FmdB family transcriptional regulator, partial [Phycisphaerales bacterium]|nr:FmdB family transcriptional regulator [Phycisphaerales bacterium]